MHGAGQDQINARMLERCQVCHHRRDQQVPVGVDQPLRAVARQVPLIYWVTSSTSWLIRARSAFFLLYIAIDWMARRRGRGGAA